MVDLPLNGRAVLFHTTGFVTKLGLKGRLTIFVAYYVIHVHCTVVYA